jgi:penicillin-binding protein 1B
MKKRTFWKIFGLTSVGSLLLLLVILTFKVVATLEQYKDVVRDQKSLFLQGGENQIMQTGIRFEAGTAIDENLLAPFSFFANDFKKYLDEGHVTIEDKQALFHWDFKLDFLYRNDCQESYCFQMRTDFSDFPSGLWKALIAIEDGRFVHHQGIDPLSLMRAIVVDIKEMAFVQGGSTLTQQLVKNLLLGQNKTLIRKFNEVVLSLYIENFLTKDQILQAYLNETYWGVLQGVKIKGVFAASWFYFNKRPRDLNHFESLILMALLNGPQYFHPIKNLERLRSRVMQLNEAGIDLADDSEIWSEQDFKKWSESLAVREADKIERLFVTTQFQRPASLDEFQQFQIFRSLYKQLMKLKGDFKDLDLAGKVLVYSRKEKDYFGVYSKIERSREKALTSESHLVGSLLKPFIYEILTHHNVSWDEMVSMDPFTMKLKSGEWSPKEAYRNYPSSVTVRQSLEKSYNRPMLKLVSRVGFEEVESELKEIVPHLKLPLSEYPSQLIGGVELTLLELATMFDKYVDDVCRTKHLEESLFSERETSLDVLTNMSATTVANYIQPSWSELKIFAKTGTSDDGRNNWVVMIDQEHVVVVWLGVESGEIPKELKLSGAKATFPIASEFLLRGSRRIKQLHCSPN